MNVCWDSFDGHPSILGRVIRLLECPAIRQAVYSKSLSLSPLHGVCYEKCNGEIAQLH